MWKIGGRTVGVNERTDGPGCAGLTFEDDKFYRTREERGDSAGCAFEWMDKFWR